MARKHRVLWLTKRGRYHQNAVLQAAPSELDVIILRDPDRHNLFSYLNKAHFLVSERSEAVSAEMISVAPQLRLILRLGSLSYDIDLEAARSANVKVSVQPVLSCMMVAEHCMMMTLALLKHLNGANAIAQSNYMHRSVARTSEDQFAYNWAGLATVQRLYNKTVAVIGMGEIGVEFVRRLRGFRPAAILYHKRTPYPSAIELELGIQYADLPTCYAQADIFVFLLPYSPETDLMVNGSAFFRMKRGALVVHAGSGATLDENALTKALESGHLGGAALDTFEYEPLLSDHPLVPMASDPAANVILTPHIAAATLNPNDTSRARDFDEIMRYLRGEPLRWEQ